MNVDELRTALHEPPPPLAVDLDRVLARGRRRRATQRSGLAAAVLAVVAVVTVPMVVRANGRSHVETAAPLPVSATSRPATAACARIDVPAWGDVIRTGDVRGGRERVYWFVPITKPLLLADGSRFSLIAGWRTPDARCVIGFGLNADPHTEALEFEPGFHGVYTATPGPEGPGIPAGDWSTVGWYVGPVAKVTATIGGKVVTARLARWSVRRWPVMLFWFSADTGGTPAHLPAGARVTGVTAYDAAGRRLPAGRYTAGGD